MFPEHELLRQWGIPFTLHGGVTLVERRNAAVSQRNILRGGCRLYGYDAFAVSADSIQPFLEFSPDWSGVGVPLLEVVLSQLSNHPPQITHYEFVFDAA